MKSDMNMCANQADKCNYHHPSCTPGAWIGLIMHMDTPFLMKVTTANTWGKFKTGLNKLLQLHHEGRQFVETATLRSLVGLGVHITEVYWDGRSYLKDFLNTAGAWRGDEFPRSRRLMIHRKNWRLSP